MIEGFYVYVYSDPRDGEAFYVGKGRKYRAFKHLHQTHSRSMRMKLQQLADAGVEPKIEIVQTASEQDAYQLEAMLIEAYGRRCDGSGSLFNVLADGEKTTGFKGRTHTAESRAKISAATKGRPKSQQMKDKNRLHGLRRGVSHLHTEESRVKQREAINSPTYRAKQSSSQKANWTPAKQADMIARAATATRGTTRSAEHRAAISKAMKSRVVTDEMRANMSAAQKRRYAK